MSGVEGAEREDYDGCEARLACDRVMNLALLAQNLAQLVIDFYRVLRGLIDQFDPAARVLGRSCLRNQVGGLHNGFERIAEIVRQRSEFFRQFRRDFIGGISHGLAGRGSPALV
jgi:hypothetical protein